MVASDVASEDINLHYLSHRMIHFDIPWSLMVFQQRNGRIDRYGQTKEPDIRYLVMQTTNERIRGDIRMLEVLIRKEEQAAINIGDPALLMKVYDSQKEEEITAEAMETGDAEAFDESLNVDEDFDIFSFLENLDEEEETLSSPDDLRRVQDRTLMSDIDYLHSVLSWLSQTQRYSVEDMSSVEGLFVGMTDDMKRRWKNTLPEEAIPDLLQLPPADFDLEVPSVDKTRE